ncbi:unnamed protein product [Nyctereutes procyonoides]|uniref:H/ACA ribonucleoprotein complex subunit 2 n=1 Tax=Nyctereutes procyonoides TaxID=34880 RepID=A0A811ZVK8_NYCPR|nr:unnamed protein product [Nyctereutes procyonoides]
MITEADVNPKAYPLADAHLTKKLLDAVQQSCNYKQLWKGAHETPSPWRSSRTFRCLPREEKNVSYEFLHSKQALRWACGVSGPVLACSVTIQEGSQPKPQIQSIQQSIKRLFV